MNLSRINPETIRLKQSAELLQQNEAFIDAVTKVMNQYAVLEEKCLTDASLNPQDMSSKIVQFAMMRKALADVVNQLNSTIIDGNNAEYNSQQPSY